MEPATDGAITITTRLPTSLNGELDALAKATGRDKDELMEEALRRLIEVERWQIALIALIEGRVRQADARNFAGDEEVARVYAKFNIRRRDQSERVAG